MMARLYRYREVEREQRRKIIIKRILGSVVGWVLALVLKIAANIWLGCHLYAEYLKAHNQESACC